MVTNIEKTRSPDSFSANWSLDHVAHAVEDIEKTLHFYTETFGFSVDLREELPEHKVLVAFLTLANTKIELIQPMAQNKTLNKLLEKRGSCLHHLCFEVPDVSKELARLKNQGIRLIDEFPRPGAYNTSIAFLHPQDTEGVLIELCQPME